MLKNHRAGNPLTPATGGLRIKRSIPHGHVQAVVGTIERLKRDHRNLGEITSPDFPGKRLVVCRNPALAARRSHQALLTATVGHYVVSTSLPTAILSADTIVERYKELSVERRLPQHQDR